MRFKGTLGQGDYGSVLAFLEKFDSRAEQEGLTDVERTTRISQYLDDKALTWFNNNKGTWGTSYDKIRQALVTRFLTDGQAPDKWLTNLRLQKP